MLSLTYLCDGTDAIVNGNLNKICLCLNIISLCDKRQNITKSNIMLTNNSRSK